MLTIILRQWIVQLVDLFVVVVVGGEPDAVQIDCGGEGAQDGHNLEHLRGVGRHLGQIGVVSSSGGGVR